MPAEGSLALLWRFTNAGLREEKSRGQRPPTRPYDTVENLGRVDGDAPMTDVDTTAPAPGATWRPRHNPWLIAVVVTLAAFMEILDTTIVNVALRYIAGDLAVSNDDATWVLTSYLVSNGIVLTISGWLGDVLGRKRPPVSRNSSSSGSRRASSAAACSPTSNRSSLIHFHLPSVAPRSGSRHLPPSSLLRWGRRSAATSLTS